MAANMAAADAEGQGSFNVGTGVETSINQLAGVDLDYRTAVLNDRLINSISSKGYENETG